MAIKEPMTLLRSYRFLEGLTASMVGLNTHNRYLCTALTNRIRKEMEAIKAELDSSTVNDTIQRYATIEVEDGKKLGSEESNEGPQAQSTEGQIIGSLDEIPTTEPTDGKSLKPLSLLKTLGKS